MKNKHDDICIKNYSYFKQNPIEFVEKAFQFISVYSTTFDNTTNKMFEYEKLAFTKMLNSERYFIIKSRQMRLSTLYSRFMFYYIFFKNDLRILYVSHSMWGSKNIRDKLLRAFKSTSISVLSPTIIRENKNSVKFSNNVTIDFSHAENRNNVFLKGKSYNVIILDECGSYDDLANIFHDCQVMSYTGVNNKLLMGTSVYDKGNFFNMLGSDLMESSNWESDTFLWLHNPLFLRGMYDNSDILSFEWYKYMRRNNDKKVVNNEINCGLSEYLLKFYFRGRQVLSEKQYPKFIKK
jgi:hypothetical protein